ncbi:MAG: sigma 54-interacting transcriptional regulator [Myxococcota bacterium]
MGTDRDSNVLSHHTVDTYQGQSTPEAPCIGVVPALTIAHHPDPSRVGERARLTGVLSGEPVALSRLAPTFRRPDGEPTRPLADRWISRQALWFEADHGGGLRLRPEGRRVRVLVDGRPLHESRSVSASDLDRGVVLCLAERVVLVVHRLLPATRRRPGFGLVGESDALERVRGDISVVADMDIPVLIQGESGVGKELVAQAIHAASDRRTGPFVPVNMAAVPPSMAPAELFGHRRGSFTHAVGDRHGYFGQARGGTLFLDEIGDVPLEVQAMLLRVLDSGEIQRVGDPQRRRTDVRVLAATDADLVQAISDGRFRSQLLYRLAGYEIVIPPLWQRRDDVGRLLVHFLREDLAAAGRSDALLDRARGGGHPWLSASLVERLVRYDWPGNVRQLRNVVRQLVVASRDRDRIRVPESVARVLDGTAPGLRPQRNPRARPAPRTPVPRTMEPSDIGEDHLVETLRRHRWQPSRAARALGISRTSLYKLMDASERVRKAGDLTDEELRRAYETCSGDPAAMSDLLMVSKRGLLLRLQQLGLR